MNDKFDIIIELLSTAIMKGTTTGEMYEQLSTTLERHKLSGTN
jgi:hypothetical protein